MGEEQSVKRKFKYQTRISDWSNAVSLGWGGILYHSQCHQDLKQSVKLLLWVVLGFQREDARETTSIDFYFYSSITIIFLSIYFLKYSLYFRLHSTISSVAYSSYSRASKVSQFYILTIFLCRICSYSSSMSRSEMRVTLSMLRDSENLVDQISSGFWDDLTIDISLKDWLKTMAWIWQCCLRTYWKLQSIWIFCQRESLSLRMRLSYFLYQR